MGKLRLIIQILIVCYGKICNTISSYVFSICIFCIANGVFEFRNKIEAENVQESYPLQAVIHIDRTRVNFQENENEIADAAVFEFYN